MSFTLAIKTLFKASISNEQLMLAYAEKADSKLLSQLYDQCADDLYHFLLSQAGSELAKDISQLTWLKVIEKKHLYRDSGRFTAWLFTLSRHLLIDELRKSGRLCNLNDKAQLSCSSPLESSFSNIHKAFDQALRNLCFEQRESFCLQQEGFSLVEIANITSSPIETIKSRLRYAKASLKKQLENDHE
jgi:RNA polymerase sigma factor (sigma-70 family)